VRQALLFLLLSAENSLAKYLPATNRLEFFGFCVVTKNRVLYQFHRFVLSGA
jgi:hypothetical protein